MIIAWNIFVCRSLAETLKMWSQQRIRRIVPFKNGILKYQIYYISIIYIHCVYYFCMDDRKHDVKYSFPAWVVLFQIVQKGWIYNEIILYTCKCLTNQMVVFFLGRGVGLIPVWKENRYVVNKIFYNFLFKISCLYLHVKEKKMQIMSGP